MPGAKDSRRPRTRKASERGLVGRPVVAEAQHAVVVRGEPELAGRPVEARTDRPRAAAAPPPRRCPPRRARARARTPTRRPRAPASHPTIGPARPRSGQAAGRDSGTAKKSNRTGRPGGAPSMSTLEAARVERGGERPAPVEPGGHGEHERRRRLVRDQQPRRVVVDGDESLMADLVERLAQLLAERELEAVDAYEHELVGAGAGARDGHRRAGPRGDGAQRPRRAAAARAASERLPRIAAVRLLRRRAELVVAAVHLEEGGRRLERLEPLVRAQDPLRRARRGEEVGVEQVEPVVEGERRLEHAAAGASAARDTPRPPTPPAARSAPCARARAGASARRSRRSGAGRRGRRRCTPSREGDRPHVVLEVPARDLGADQVADGEQVRAQAGHREGGERGGGGREARDPRPRDHREGQRGRGHRREEVQRVPVVVDEAALVPAEGEQGERQQRARPRCARPAARRPQRRGPAARDHDRGGEVLPAAPGLLVRARLAIAREDVRRVQQVAGDRAGRLAGEQPEDEEGEDERAAVQHRAAQPPCRRDGERGHRAEGDRP